MLMTVLVADAKLKLQARDVNLSAEVATNELLYADDTLLVETDGGNIQSYMQAVSEAGQNYGLSFNWSKLEVMSMAGPCLIPTPTG